MAPAFQLFGLEDCLVWDPLQKFALICPVWHNGFISSDVGSSMHCRTVASPVHSQTSRGVPLNTGTG